MPEISKDGVEQFARRTEEDRYAIALADTLGWGSDDDARDRLRVAAREDEVARRRRGRVRRAGSAQG